MSNKHKHYNMIVAKAANMDLVVFSKGSGEWVELHCMPRWGDNEYFLCLPQHKEACLHWLNGGKVIFKNPHGKERESCSRSIYWSHEHAFMDDSELSHIKPRKEKRWIGVFKDGDLLINTELSYKTKEQVKGDAYAPHGFDNWQFIEIEVEV